MHLGNVHYILDEYDLALYYHKKALELRQAIPTTESTAIASSLHAIAKTYWARGEHSEATANAEQALAIREALVPSNETSVATTLALLGDIYQDFGDTTHALTLYTKALTIFECTVSAQSPILAETLYKLGRIQSCSEALADAQNSLERSVKIYRKILPKGHQDRTLAENELRRIIQLRQTNKENSRANS
jgi:tetratricopeptide (TPR) repeat protein